MLAVLMLFQSAAIPTKLALRATGSASSVVDVPETATPSEHFLKVKEKLTF